jgi:hypothetical protein
MPTSTAMGVTATLSPSSTPPTTLGGTIAPSASPTPSGTATPTPPLGATLVPSPQPGLLSLVNHRLEL